MSRKMKLAVSVLLAFLLLLPAIPASAAVSVWESVGPDFSAPEAYCTSLAFCGSTPYVAYADGSDGGSVHIVRHSGMAWEGVSANGISEFPLYISFVFSGDTPYLAYSDKDNGTKATVVRLNSETWVPVGVAGFSAGSAQYTSLAFSGTTPYVAYSDGSNGYRATVMKLGTTGWEVVGAPGFSAGQCSTISLAFSGDTPYVAYSDGSNGYRATVMKLGATGWEYVGVPGFSAAGGSFTSLAFSGSIPYVAYKDEANNSKTTVMRYTGGGTTGWEAVGSAGFSAGEAWYISLAFSGTTPYVAYKDGGSSGRATVMRYTGSGTTGWEAVGPAGFSTGEADYLSFAFGDGVPYVAYVDQSHSGKATMMRLSTYDAGSITVNGTPGAVYQIKQGSTVVRDDITIPAGGSVTENDLRLGTYTVAEKTPPSGCLPNAPQSAVLSTDGQTVSVTFASYRPVSITTQKSDATVFGGTDGRITVTASGGAGTYEYSIGGTWQSSNVFSGLAGGTYFVRARDKVHPANVCTAVSVQISQPGVDGTCLLSKLPSKVWKSTFYQLTVPAGYTNTKFTSGNSTIATVTGSGLVHFIKSGKVRITMKATYNGKSKTVYKTVTVAAPVKSITLGYKDLSLTQGKLTASILPSDASSKSLSWSSSDPKVASVSQSGVVTAKKPGMVTITVKAKDGSGVKATIVLVVRPSLQKPPV